MQIESPPPTEQMANVMITALLPLVSRIIFFINVRVESSVLLEMKVSRYLFSSSLVVNGYRWIFSITLSYVKAVRTHGPCAMVHLLVTSSLGRRCDG